MGHFINRADFSQTEKQFFKVNLKFWVHKKCVTNFRKWDQIEIHTYLITMHIHILFCNGMSQQTINQYESISK